MTTTASSGGHSGTKDFHQIQFASRLLSVRSTDANASGVAVGVAGNSIRGAGVGIVCSGEGHNKAGKSSNNSNTINKNRIGLSMKDQLPVLKPDTLLNDTGLFTVYCFVKDFIGASGTSAVAIDNKIEQAMDLVKSHLMIAVREEVEVLKEKISELMDKINQLEVENTILKANMPQETLHQLQLQTQLQITGTGAIAQPPSQQAQSQQQQAPQQQQTTTQQSQQQPSQQQNQQQPPQQQQQQQPQPQQPTPQAANPANTTTNGPMS